MITRRAKTGPRLPALSGRPVRVELHRDLGPHHAAASIPRRLILLDAGVLRDPGEFERILVHELFHFVWVRLSNAARREWEAVLAAEFAARVPGELGWSAEWRKARLTAPATARITAHDIRKRTLPWRRYACESFCDTAAWLYAGLRRHPEFTLPVLSRRARRAWFQRRLAANEPVRF